jgi:hypothetical protein
MSQAGGEVAFVPDSAAEWIALTAEVKPPRRTDETVPIHRNV